MVLQITSDSKTVLGSMEWRGDEAKEVWCGLKWLTWQEEEEHDTPLADYEKGVDC